MDTTAESSAGTDDRPPPRALDARGLERLSHSLADQFAALYDVGPSDPRASLDGNVLTFSFRGGLSVSDEWMLETGKEEQLREFREHFLRAVGPQLGEVVQALSGAQVRHFFPAFELASRTTSCFFVLGEALPDEAEQRQALLNWSEQVRRNARDLRTRHRRAREAHARLRDLLREARVDRHEAAVSEGEE